MAVTRHLKMISCPQHSVRFPVSLCDSAWR